MKIIYLEYRAAARILLESTGQRAPLEGVVVASSTLLEIQLQRTLERQRASGAWSDAKYTAKRLETHALLGLMHLFPFGEEVLELARLEFPFSVAVAESIHVATAQVVAQEGESLEFWTHDAGAAAAARHRGLTVLGVEERA